MTNSAEPSLATLLDRLRREVDESVLAATIDEPIDRVVDETPAQNQRAEAFSVEGFHRMLTRLVQRIYREALPVPRTLTDEQSFAIGLNWLENHYVSQGARGYAAAMLDAADENWDGIHLVCRALADAMKQEFRRMKVSALLTRILAPFDWRRRIALVHACFDHCKELLPATMTALPPAQLVDELPAILLLVLSLEQPIRTNALT